MIICSAWQRHSELQSSSLKLAISIKDTKTCGRAPCSSCDHHGHDLRPSNAFYGMLPWSFLAPAGFGQHLAHNLFSLFGLFNLSSDITTRQLTEAPASHETGEPGKDCHALCTDGVRTKSKPQQEQARKVPSPRCPHIHPPSRHIPFCKPM